MAPDIEKKEESVLWKDEVNRDLVLDIGKKIKRAYRGFKVDAFADAVTTEGFENLELKDRLDKISRAFGEFLPSDFPKAAKIAVKAAPDIKGFGNWALTMFVDSHGHDDFELAVDTLAELTKHGTAEFAVRSFINARPAFMIKKMTRWAKDKNEDVRRLAAEGTRPRGVWVAHIDSFRKDPTPVIKLLDILRDDPSLYVRKAVANNLNDISKDHPDVAIATGLRWQKDKSERTDWIIKHGCRTLIKQGHPDVFPLLGFTARPKVEVETFKLSTKRLKIGDKLKLSAVIMSEAKKKQRLAIDLRMHYVKKNGKTSPKVFKWSEKDLPAGKRLDLNISRSFKDVSTRKHHPGTHRAEIVINGISHGELEFDVKR